jgi:hypothetical protein
MFFIGLHHSLTTTSKMVRVGISITDLETVTWGVSETNIGNSLVDKRAKSMALGCKTDICISNFF